MQALVFAAVLWRWLVSVVCIMGALSRIKLADVGAAFVKKLEERLNVRKDLGGRAADHITQRQQLLKLCTGKGPLIADSVMLSSGQVQPLVSILLAACSTVNAEVLSL